MTQSYNNNNPARRAEASSYTKGINKKHTCDSNSTIWRGLKSTITWRGTIKQGTGRKSPFAVASNTMTHTYGSSYDRSVKIFNVMKCKTNLSFTGSYPDVCDTNAQGIAWPGRLLILHIEVGCHRSTKDGPGEESRQVRNQNQNECSYQVMSRANLGVAPTPTLNSQSGAAELAGRGGGKG